MHNYSNTWNKQIVIKTCRILPFLQISQVQACKMTPFSWFREFAPPIEKIPAFSRKWVRAWYTFWWENKWPTQRRRPEYIERLTRKQSQATLRARASMMTVNMHHKNGHETLECRYCSEAEETQEHIILECTKITKDEETIRYADIFKENNKENNRARARAIIKINKNQYNQSHKHRLPMKWATWYTQAYAMCVCMICSITCMLPVISITHNVILRPSDVYMRQ